jgi:peptidoglycan/xylan/chitin deacetylase (PgdA/CDA1 family)
MSIDEPERILERRASKLGSPALLVILGSALVAGGTAAIGVPVPAWVLLASLLGLVAALVLGVTCQPSGIFAKPLISAHTQRREVALTFDDGPDPRTTPAILDALEAGGHRGTFFVIGARAAAHRQLLEEIAKRGHGLENHSFRHSYLTNLVAPKRLAEDLRQTSALIQGATGRRPRWFRPPVGLLSPRVAEAARRAQLDLVAWTANARDGVPSRTVSAALARLERHLRPGAILVLHDGRVGGGTSPIALSVLTAVLGRMDAMGLRSVSLDRLLDSSQG